jgi:CheY-like chemotaxis protein
MALLLVVDDDAAVLAMVRKILERDGHDVTVAEDGVEAIRQASTRRFDLLLVDKNLPGMNGLEVIALVRRTSPALPAILMTAYPEPILKPTAELQGYLAKPFESMGKISEAVDRALWLGKIEQQRQPAPNAGASSTSTSVRSQVEAPSSDASDSDHTPTGGIPRG